MKNELNIISLAAVGFGVYMIIRGATTIEIGNELKEKNT